ncbi:hypothetical protein GCM10009688_18680 [Arthrobacter gandavensis]|uniref:Uncharacterized protein n=1 Tax=Arthrobacter gandavensis TaxID=169960 RepID=A0ABN2P8D8_9MICC|nr:hypothetical protein [Arthrobacter citreus]
MNDSDRFAAAAVEGLLSGQRTTFDVSEGTAFFTPIMVLGSMDVNQELKSFNAALLRCIHVFETAPALGRSVQVKTATEDLAASHIRLVQLIRQDLNAKD